MSGGLVEGSVVFWEQSPGAKYGVVVASGQRIEVLFDDNERRIFVARNAPISRVRLPPQVRRRSTDEAGLLIEPAELGGAPAWKVLFLTPQGTRERIVRESDLRPDDALGPVERIKAGDLGTWKQSRLALTARYFHLEHLHNDLVSLAAARVDLKPHQVGVAHRVVSSYPHRFLLCDEVGLGKTIEAGMIIKELRARGAASRVLIIVPPNLRRQWQFELKTKFNESFAIYDTSTVEYLRKSGLDGNPFMANDSVIVSSSWISGRQWAGLAKEVDWDLVVVDEAHHVRRRRVGGRSETTQLYNLVRDLASPSEIGHRGLLFLTATPMQLDAYELYSLVELIDPALFPTEQHFERHRMRVPGLSRLVEELDRHGFPIPGEDNELVVARVAKWLDAPPEAIEKRLLEGRDQVEAVCDELSERHLLSEIMIRNRKSVVGGFMPRHAMRWPVELTDLERHALEAVENYVRNGWNRGRAMNETAIGFVMTIFQKLMASSIRALRESLDRRRIRLVESTATRYPTTADTQELLEEDRILAADAVGTVDELVSGEIEELEALVALLDQVGTDTKAQVFLEQLETIFEAEPDAKILVFTEFRDTQKYLAEQIMERGWNAHVFHGQMSPEAKDQSVDAFREGDGPQILVATEAGGEGRNFQFCHLLVNYDLPWNPMRVEQRIGRVDRIGQTEPVRIFNLWVKGTIEERVLDILEKRINVFEETVGGLDPILGAAEKSIRDVLFLDPAQRDDAYEKLSEDLEKQVREAREAEEKLQDFIMNTKSFSRAIAERIAGTESPITPDDQARFVKALLADVRTFVGPAQRGEHEVVFHEPFVSEYPEFVRDGVRRRVVFRADERQDAEHVEYFAFGHPIVDALLDRVLAPDYAGAAGARCLIADGDLPPVGGWLFTYVVSVSGIRAVERLEPIFISDDGSVDDDIAWQIVRRSAGSSQERAVAAEAVPLAQLDEAATLAEQIAAARLSEIEEEVRIESVARAGRERRKLLGYFEYREQAARDRLENTSRVLGRLEASEEASQRQIIPVWRANLERDERLLEELGSERARRLRELEQRINPTGDLMLVAVTRIDVVPA